MLVFITTGVFGQKFIRSHSFIEATPTGNNTIEDAINRTNIEFTNFDWIHYVHFVQNDRLFLLSYEPKEDRMFGGSRSIYLYSKDLNDVTSSWEEASDAVMTNHWSSDRNHDEVDFFIYDKNKHNSSVGKVIVEDGCIKMTIGWEMYVDGSELIRKPITITFKPVGDNKYSHQ